MTTYVCRSRMRCLVHTRNNSIHEYSTRGMNEIHVPFGRLDIRNFSIGIHGAKVWNSLPSSVKQSRSLELFKNTLRNYLCSSESIVTVTHFWWFYNPICFVLKVTHFWWLLPYLIFSCDQAALWMVQSVCLSVRPSVRPERFPGICRRLHGGISLKFYMLMYLDHLQNWLVYGYGLVIFLILALFGLSETGQIWGFRVFPRERMEEMAWNLARWCILTTFRTD